MVTRIAADAIFIPATRWGCNRFLAAGCKSRGKVKALRYQGTLGVLVVGPVAFITQMEAAFNV